MSKSKIILSLTGFVLAAAIAYPAQAKPKNKGQCQGNWWERVEVWDAKCPKEARKVDRDGNYDDYVCENYRYGVIKYRDNKGKGDYDHDNDDGYDEDDNGGY
jgi:hypothetical protein